MSTTPVILMLSYEKTKPSPDLKLDSTLIGKGFEEQGEDNRKIFSHLIRSQCIVVIFRYFVHNKYNEHTKSYVLESHICGCECTNILVWSYNQIYGVLW